MYVICPDEETKRLVPKKVSPAEYHAQAMKLGVNPRQFESETAAQAACDRLNKTMRGTSR